jgi:hypothetical protein
MNNIPTAEEFLNRDESGVFSDVDIARAMIEFAKLHVEAALKAASENAEIEDIGSPNGNGEWMSHEIINQNSILNAYPLDLIK